MNRLRGTLNLAAHGTPLKAIRVRLTATGANQHLANQLRMWGPAAVWAVVLFLLSAWPDPIAPVWAAVNDKIVHLGLYSVLGGALAVGWLRSQPSPSHWLMIAVGALYGATDEWHQFVVPGRFPSWSDWIADVSGVVLGYLVVMIVARALFRPTPETQ